MYRAQRIVIALFVVAFVGAATVATAQEQQPAPIRGQLVKVDAQAMTFEVMTADGKTVTFQYTKETKVSGAENTIGGLATTKDAEVTVQYTQKGANRIATQIEVQAAAKPKQ